MSAQSPITPEARKAVVEAADNAAPGPWKQYCHGDQVYGGDDYFICVVQSKRGKIDAKFIALANPSTILAYEAALQALEAEKGKLEDEVGFMSDQLIEAQQQPWPEWADEVRKKLMSYGVDVGPEEGWNIGEDFEQWIDGVVENETERADNAEARATAAEAEVERWKGLAEAMLAHTDGLHLPSATQIIRDRVRAALSDVETAREQGREESAQKGEPSPWTHGNCDDQDVSEAECEDCKAFRDERLSTMRAALQAALAGEK